MKFTAIVRTLLLGVSSRARVLGLLAVGAVGIAVAIGLSGSSTTDPVGRAAAVVDAYGLTLLIPVAALVFGTAALGDPIEDGTYVYLWLRPIRRWQISVAAYCVTLGLVLPLAVVPTVIAAAILDDSSSTVSAAASASVLAAIAYSGVFVLLGQLTQRALVWGIAYLLIFEEFICRGGKALGFLSVHTHAVSVLSKSLGLDMALAYFARSTGWLVPPVMAVVLVLLSSARQSSMSVA
jgi:ABC-2 type transport system permease protein